MPDIVLALVLLLLIGGGWLFLAANAKAPARAMRYAAVGALVLLGIILAIGGRAFLDLPLGALIIWLARGWFAHGFPGLRRLKAWLDGKPGQAEASTIETPWLRVTRDLATGALDGAVLAGRFRGARLSQLSLDQLGALLNECGASDAQSARLVETYIDRRRGNRREHARADDEDARRGSTNGAFMTEAEAWQVLGLEPGASRDAIREAHRNLMMKLHPDHGGSNFLARQINIARDVLLRNSR
ncbi:MAG: DnaJ domain-containing protein [Rhizomicrobium sp.]